MIMVMVLKLVPKWYFSISPEGITQDGKRVSIVAIAYISFGTGNLNRKGDNVMISILLAVF
jgi:hypothetical protein